MTSTAGPTSRTTSSGRSPARTLTEHHSISVRAGDLPEDGAGAIDVLKLHAQAYARDRGFEIVSLSARVSTPVPDPREQRIAVEFDVVVGKGELALDRPEDDRWAWSYAAADHNWKLLDDLFTDPEDRPRVRGTRLRVRETGEGGKVIEGRFGDPRRMPGDWGGPAALRGEGIAEHPVHPAWSDPNHPVSRDLQATYAPPVPPATEPPAADQRPPWLRRGDGWDEEDAPGWGDHPPLG